MFALFLTRVGVGTIYILFSKWTISSICFHVSQEMSHMTEIVSQQVHINIIDDSYLGIDLDGSRYTAASGPD